MIGRFKHWLQRMRFERTLLKIGAAVQVNIDSPPPPPPGDPYAWMLVPRTTPPRGRSGAVAVVEPDDHR